MKSALSVTAGVLVAALAAGCTQSGDDDAAEDDTDTAAPGTIEQTEPPVRTEAVMPEFEVPSGLTQIDEEGVPFTLDFEHVGATYEFEGGTELERLFVTSYVLPEDQSTESFDDRKAVVELYDQVSENESESSGTRALASGYDAVFRYSIVTYDDDQKAFQRNFFIYDGNAVAQITCQWKDTEFELTVEQACQQLQEDFQFPA